MTGKAVLNEALVREIRKRVAAGESQGSVAKCVGTSFQNVSKIVARQAWKHVQ
jgi:hypothetical protein